MGDITVTFFDDVKVALRITHSKLNTELQATIDSAKAEMERAGIVKSTILDTDKLVATAIKTYCQYMFASDDKIKEGYFISWSYQLDNLRKSKNYGYEV